MTRVPATIRRRCYALLAAREAAIENGLSPSNGIERTTEARRPMLVQSTKEQVYMNYRAQLIHTLWNYAESENLGEFVDRDRSASRPPVFKKEHACLNLLYPEGADSRYMARLASVIPESRRHKWFRSTTSSQALAQSVFGNLKLLGYTQILGNLGTKDGLPFVGSVTAPMDLQYELEREVDYLGEPRRTSVDVLIETSHQYRIAVECKLSEPEVGSCSRPRLTLKDPNYARDHCDGSYTLQRDRKERCSLAAIGIGYWDHVPELFQWSADHDYPNCPLRFTYQLVRNVLAACVRAESPGKTGTASAANGHAVLLYDDRNPAFMDGGKGDRAFSEVRNGLEDSRLLRRCSWQALAGALRESPEVAWLADGMARKYGIQAREA